MARIFKPTAILITLMATLILIGSALLVGYVYLPSYLQNRLIPELAANAGLTDIDLKVRRVGIFGADLSRIRLGSSPGSGLTIDSVQIDYTPGDLINKSIRSVTIRGIELNLEYADGRLKLDESLARIFRARPGAGNDAEQLTKVALPFNRLALRQARIKLKAGGRVFTIPLELDLMPDQGSSDKMTVETVIWPRDQRFETTAKTDLEAGTAELRLRAADLQLKAFADLIEPHTDIQLGGAVSIDSKVALVLSPLGISSADTTLSWDGGGIEYNDINISPVPSSAGGRLDWHLTASTVDRGKWRITTDPIRIESQVAFQFSDFQAVVQPSSSGYQISGQVQAEPVGVDTSHPALRSLKLTQGPQIDAVFNATIANRNGWSIKFEASPTQSGMQIDMEGKRINANLASLALSAAGDGERISAQYSARVNGLTYRTESLNAAAALFALKGKTILNSASEDSQHSEISVTVTKASGSTESFRFSGAKATYDGALLTKGAEGFKAEGSTLISADTVTTADNSVQVKNIAATVPFTWPPPQKSGKAGRFHISAASFQKYRLSDVTGIVRQTSSGFDLSGRHQNAVIPGLALEFEGKSHLAGHRAPVINFNLQADRSESAPAFDLGALMPGGKGIQLSGRLEAKASLRIDAGGVDGSSILNLIDAQLEAAKDNFRVDGIRLGLEIPGLPVLRSAPGQKLQFDSATLGDIKITEGLVFFQIEPEPAVLLERGQFDWSEGRVDIHSTRIFLDREDYEITLFCDRLNLTSLLEQFGAAKAEGTGTVSGKIPIRYRNKKWSIADGFLYSSPGQGGQIRVQGTEALTAGIPKGSPQYMQLEIAREALKDYDFTWAKLTISTEEDDMLLKLQLDGKPARTLPFAFRKDIGSFARVEGEAKGSTFQGIRLDVNFRLPLNKILQYKSIIQMMRKKGVN